MPIPKPEKPEDIRVNQRTPKTLDIKVVKADHDVVNKMKVLAEQAKSKDT